MAWGTTYLVTTELLPPGRPISVSYTHLDVYKRQAVPAATLTESALRLLNSYTVGPTRPGVVCLHCADVLATWYPLDASLKAEQPPVELETTLLFRSQPSLRCV